MRRKRNPILFYLGFYGRYRLKLAGMGGLYVVKHGTAMMFPLILRHVIDKLIPAGDLNGVFMCIPLVLGLVLVNLVCHSPFTMIASDIIKSVSRDLRSLIIHKLQILSLVFIKGSDTGRFYSKIMVDVTRAEEMGRQLLVNVAGTFLTLAYAITILSLVNVKMTALFLVSVPVYGAVYWFFKSRFRKYQHQARMADEDLSQSVNQFIQTSTLARVHGEEDFEHKKIDKLGSRIVEKYKKVQFNVGAFNILVYGTSQIFQITVVAFSALAIMRGHMSIGDLVVFAQYMQMILNALSQIMNQVPVFVQGSESIRSIGEVLGSPQTEDNEDKELLEDIRGDISFRNVSFTYGQDKPALYDVTVDIPAGKTVALAGPSGSGKSTFVSMALGLIRPDGGTVSIDGNDVNTLDMRAVRRQVGVVTQDPILFKATVAENIAHARKCVDMKEVEEAARKAHAHDFIIELENGYDTILGEQGSTLSGGQKQRIAIARAILRKPRVLVLDEATSALDSVSEQEVQKGIDNLLGNQTTLTIAHRLATIRNADVILVFDRGRIVEQGSHDELVARQGVYAGMYRMQAG